MYEGGTAVKNLICNAFAFKEGFFSSLQTDRGAGEQTTEMYLKNIYVALTSAKLYNPNDDVMLITNYELTPEWKKRLEAAGILIRQVPFEEFVIPRQFPWALAFYKLCALYTIVRDEPDYGHILLLDADTFTTRSYEELWKEADYGVLLFPVGHSFHHSDREIIRRDFLRLYPEEAPKNIVHYGGEFAAGCREHLKPYLEKCLEVYERMKALDFQMEEHAGDETVWSAAAALIQDKAPVIGAGAYLFRFWTGAFYLTSTVTVFNPVCIWHIPNEKETGFLRLYAYYQKHGTFPPVEKAAAIFGIRKAKRPLNRYTISNRLFGKLKKLIGRK